MANLYFGVCEYLFKNNFANNKKHYFNNRFFINIIILYFKFVCF